LFMFDRLGPQARLNCLESETGKSLWQFAYPTDYHDIIGYDNGPRSSPIVDDDRVYIFGPEGMLHCLSVVDGKLLWKVDTADKFHVIQNFFGVGSTPVIEGDLLIAPIGGSPPNSHLDSPERLDLVKGNGSGIVAFDKLTGEVKYQITDELASYASPVLATVNSRRWCFVFTRGGLVGFDPAGGKVDFHYPWRAKELFSVNASSPVVVGDTVFISESYEIGSSLLRVRPGGCDVVWKDPPGIREEKSMRLHWNTPICVDGYLYGSSGRHTEPAELRCVEQATGKVKWSEPNLSRVSLLYVDGHFVVLTEYGHLQLIRATPEKYDQVAAVVLKNNDVPTPAGLAPLDLLPHPAWAAPILSHGLLYIRGKDRLACLELIPEKEK
jgi:outer membrane protein assembly factor BamB